uniref:FTH domain-containing protein n=1 Tax=Panagrellus redivivus TaxID=6233 RepID=A0A7E4VVN6_PANRE
MVTTSKLYHHILHDIFNQVRVYGNGEAMVLTGLAGKANLEVLKHSVNEFVVAVLESKRLHLKNIDKDIDYAENEDVIGCAYKANMVFLARFVTKHHLALRCSGLSPAELIPENITELTLTEGTTKNTVASIIKRFENLKVLNVPQGAAYWLLREVKSTGLRLDNLASLTMRLSPEELRTLVNLTPQIVFPEEVHLYVFESALVDISVALTFPEVKKVHIHVGFTSCVNINLLKTVSKTIPCFPNAKFPTIMLYSEHTKTDTDPAEIGKLYNWLNVVKFDTIVNVVYEALVNLDRFKGPEQVRENLLNFGFIQKRTVDGYIMVRDFPWVNLTHNIVNVKGLIEEADPEEEEENEEPLEAGDRPFAETGSEDDDNEDEDDVDSSE